MCKHVVFYMCRVKMVAWVPLAVQERRERRLVNDL